VTNGKNVIICAPTGAGKTVVGGLALQLCVQSSYKGCFYSPLKAFIQSEILRITENPRPQCCGTVYRRYVYQYSIYMNPLSQSWRQKSIGIWHGRRISNVSLEEASVILPPPPSATTPEDLKI